MSENYGVINEIGDLGLGFHPITESEQDKIKQNNDDKED